MISHKIFPKQFLYFHNPDTGYYEKDRTGA